MKKTISILPIILIFGFLSFAPIVTARLAETVCKAPVPMIKNLQTDWPTSPLGGYELKPESTLADLVGYFFGWGIGLGGLAVFITLIIAGIEYITSIADPKKLQDAKDRIKSSLIGLVLLLSSWAIFNLINPNLTKMAAVLPQIPQNQNDNIALSDKECSQAIDCCNDTSGAFDQTCVPKNWRCCMGNDTSCIEKGKPSMTAAGTKDNWADCTGNADCKSMDCGCNYGIDPSGAKANWKKICVPNPKICVAVSGAPEMGCNIVRFYSEPNFNGNHYTDGNFYNVTGSYYDITANGGGINSNWIYFPQGTVAQPKSYEAFTYLKSAAGGYLYLKNNNGDTTSVATEALKDSKGDPIPAMQQCGFLACGCQINRCLDNTKGAGGDDCVNQTSDKNSKEFMEWAYSENNLEYVSGIIVKDKTKQDAVTSIINKSQNFVGAIWDLLGF